MVWCGWWCPARAHHPALCHPQRGPGLGVEPHHVFTIVKRKVFVLLPWILFRSCLLFCLIWWLTWLPHGVLLTLAGPCLHPAVTPCCSCFLSGWNISGSFSLSVGYWLKCQPFAFPRYRPSPFHLGMSNKSPFSGKWGQSCAHLQPFLLDLWNVMLIFLFFWRTVHVIDPFLQTQGRTVGLISIAGVLSVKQEICLTMWSVWVSVVQTAKLLRVFSKHCLYLRRNG